MAKNKTIIGEEENETNVVAKIGHKSLNEKVIETSSSLESLKNYIIKNTHFLYFKYFINILYVFYNFY